MFLSQPIKMDVSDVPNRPLILFFHPIDVVESTLELQP